MALKRPAIDDRDAERIETLRREIAMMSTSLIELSRMPAW